jgi:hypothetical protein
VFAECLKEIFSFNASVNFYMFAGGTTFGMMNGANGMAPSLQFDTSSYGTNLIE